jgi:hypothetical protein
MYHNTKHTLNEYYKKNKGMGNENVANYDGKNSSLF